MTLTPFDEPIAFDRGRGRLNAEAHTALAGTEALRFIANDIGSTDRPRGPTLLPADDSDGMVI